MSSILKNRRHNDRLFFITLCVNFMMDFFLYLYNIWKLNELKFIFFAVLLAFRICTFTLMICAIDALINQYIYIYIKFSDDKNVIIYLHLCPLVIISNESLCTYLKFVSWFLSLLFLNLFLLCNRRRVSKIAQKNETNILFDFTEFRSYWSRPFWNDMIFYENEIYDNDFRWVST